jgi:microcystin-dependent protein
LDSNMKKILTSFLMLAAGVVFASQPLVQGEMDISSYTEQNVGTQYRIVGEFRDLSVVGFTGADIAISNLVFTETVLGDCDAWRITNVVAAGAVKMTVDVIFAQSGSSTVGMVAGYAALASLSTNSVGFPQIPSPEFCHLSGNLLSQIRNYSFTRIQSGGGGSGTLTNEVDPVWGGVSNLVVYKAETNGWTVLPHAAWITNYDESDPVWAGKSNTVVYTNNAKLLAAITNETYLGTITGATIAASSANAVTITGPNAAITWDTNAAGGGGIADLSGWSGFAATQDVNLDGFTISNGSFVGNGAGLTNAPYGNVYIESNNIFSSITTQRIQNASVGLVEIESNPGDAGALGRYITRSGDSMVFYQDSQAGMQFSVGGANLINAHLGYVEIPLLINGVISNTVFYGNGAGITNVSGQLTTAEKILATNSIQIGGAASVVSLQVTGLSGNGAVPVGAVMQYISSNAPAGWLLCNGAAVSTNIYSNLFAVIGLQYGGATTNMNLPDLRGRVAVGMGSGSGLTIRNFYGVGGAENVALVTIEMPRHRHSIGGTTGTGTYPLSGGAGSVYGNVDQTDYIGGNSTPGIGAAHQNMPPYLVINYIIKY